MSDIFLSYSRKDVKLVSSLAETLEELGYSVWWDVSRLHGGQQFAKVIQQEINQAQCVIVVWSKASVESKWVHAEASMADQRDVLLTTVCQNADIPLPFNTRHNENLKGWKGDPYDDHFQKLLQAVIRYCPVPSGSKVPRLLKSKPELGKAKNTFAGKALLFGITSIAVLASGLAYLQVNKSDNVVVMSELNTAEATISDDNSARVEAPLSHTSKTTETATNQLQPSPAVKETPAKLEEAKPAERLPFEPEMVKISEGTFTVGCVAERDNVEDGCYDYEKPAHEVNINAFYMGKYEVTVGQYMACVDAKACPEPHWKEKEAPDFYKKLGKALTGEDYPIVGISWNNTQSYINWLNKETNQNYRLPTEAEWEYAARGGNNTKAFPWGNKASHDFMNYGEDECCAGLIKGKDKWKYTSPVGSFPENDFGLYDMHGNVWEWVQDAWHDNYDNAPVDGSEWLSETGAYRVLRGGSWFRNGRSVRSAFRDGRTPAGRSDAIGFRLARGPA